MSAEPECAGMGRLVGVWGQICHIQVTLLCTQFVAVYVTLINIDTCLNIAHQLRYAAVHGQIMNEICCSLWVSPHNITAC